MRWNFGNSSDGGQTVASADAMTANPLSDADEETPADQLPDPLAGYMNLVEGYLDKNCVPCGGQSRRSALSDRLQGHYQVAGRTDGGNLKYFLAVRRSDARCTRITRR